MKKYLSWSEAWLFRSRYQQWYDQYIDGIQFEPNEKMILGSIFHKAAENKYYPWQSELKTHGWDKYYKPFSKCLIKIQPYLLKEAEMPLIASLPDETKLFCIFDRSDPNERLLDDFKTFLGEDERWNQRIVDNHKQLTFYAAAWWLARHEYLKEMRIFAVNLSKGNIKRFETTRGPKDVQEGLKWIEDVVRDMKKLGLWGKRLSRKEIENKHTLNLFNQYDKVPAYI